MNDTILVINCGSSSLKIAIFDASFQRLGSALAERLGQSDAFARSDDNQHFHLKPGSAHREALGVLVSHFQSTGLLRGQPLAIGHRVVHGGEAFREAVVINPQVLDTIAACASLAPLHNPVNLLGIEATAELFPDVAQVAVFDTAFHQTLPEKAFLYALPTRFYRDWGIRRYGFHGTSHRYMLSETARLLDKPESEVSLVSAHLGNGCSITAIRDGASVDTSMGLTPLEGLVMGTRSGDVDPGLFDFLAGKGLDPAEAHRILNNESGLLGLSGQTNDMRTLSEMADHGHAPSALAIDVFCFRLARYIGAMMASLKTLDALVFTGGIGENSARVRAITLAQLELFGFRLDEELNRHHGAYTAGRIDASTSRHRIMVIPTNEELMIAREAVATTSG